MTGQPLITIPVDLLDGRSLVASQNGNNASWLCVCGYRLPLIWTSFRISTPTICPECGKVYMGTAPGRGGKPTKVKQEPGGAE